VGSDDPIADATYITGAIVFCRAYLLEFFRGAFAIGWRYFMAGFHWRTCRRHRTIPSLRAARHHKAIAFAGRRSAGRAIAIAAADSIIEFS